MALRRLILAIIIIVTSIASYLFLQQQEKIDIGKIILYGNVDIREAPLAQKDDHVKQNSMTLIPITSTP